MPPNNLSKSTYTKEEQRHKMDKHAHTFDLFVKIILLNESAAVFVLHNKLVLSWHFGAFMFVLHCRRASAAAWDSWLQEQPRYPRPSWLSWELLSAVRWATFTVISSVIFFNTLFMNIINNVNVFQFYEGYGQTECTAGCTMSMPGDWSAGKI